MRLKKITWKTDDMLTKATARYHIINFIEGFVQCPEDGESVLREKEWVIHYGHNTA